MIGHLPPNYLMQLSHQVMPFPTCLGKRPDLTHCAHGSSSYPFDGTPQAFRLLISTQTLTLAGRSAGKSSR